MKNKNKLANISVIAIISAVSAVLMYFDFPLPIAPSFYKIDFSDLPGLIGGFVLGPLNALVIQFVTIIIKLILKPSSTAFVGELSAFIISSAYCVTASYVYQKNKTKRGAAKSLLIASVAQVVVAAVVNYFLIIPAYVKFMNIPLEVIISMGQKIFPAISNTFTFVLLCTIPFNFVKVLIVDVMTFISYKRISPILKNITSR